MNILSILQCTELGGMEQSCLRFMDGLQARGHRCSVVSVNPVGQLGSLLQERGIEATGVPFQGRLGWRSHWRLRQTIRYGLKTADAVYMTGPTVSGILSLSQRRTLRRVLNVQFHHAGVQPPWAWRLLYRLVVARFDAVTFPSDYIRQEAEDLWPPLRPISRTIRNPFPLPDLANGNETAAARRALGLPIDRPIIGNAGWLIPRKRFDVFLDTAAVIRRTLPEALFIVAGDGDKRGALVEQAAKLGLSDSVRWLGWQRDLNSFYRSLDLLVFNTDWDAFPTTPLEAMGHGKAVIASSAHGGLKELVTNPEHGVLLSEHDAERLGSEAVRLLTSESARKEMGRRARERVATLCDMELCVSSLESLLVG